MLKTPFLLLPVQVVVQGIPWSYTWKELKEMFSDIDGIERTDVGRRRVSLSSGGGRVWKIVCGSAAWLS